jgi:phospholipid-binding lipoprotein MlaA
MRAGSLMHRAARLVACVAATAAFAGLGGCAAPGNGILAQGAEAAAANKVAVNPVDPWERFNRAVFSFNDSVDQKFLLPVAQAYKKFVPGFVVQGFDNLINNVGEVWSATNHLLQGKPREALETGLRFGVNTVFGLGGLLDIASEMGIERRSEDFGQTLGVWGFGPGPYLVLPVFGPSNVRDGLAMPLDRSTGLSSLPSTDGGVAGVALAEAVHTRASLISASALLGQVALDRYSFIRDSFLARRRSAVYDGNPPPEPEDAEPAGASGAQKSK